MQYESVKCSNQQSILHNSDIGMSNKVLVYLMDVLMGDILHLLYIFENTKKNEHLREEVGIGIHPFAKEADFSSNIYFAYSKNSFPFSQVSLQFLGSTTHLQTKKYPWYMLLEFPEHIWNMQLAEQQALI